MARKKRNSALLSLKIYRTSSVFVRDFIFVLLIIAIPFSIMSFTLYNNGKASLERQIEESNKANLLRCAGVLDTIINDIETLSSYFSMQNEVNFFVWGNSSANVDELTQIIKQTTLTKKYIDSFYIYSQISDSIISGNYVYSTNDITDNGWHQTYMNIKDIEKTNVSLRLKYNKYPYLISVIKPILSADKTTKCGAIVINIDIDKLLDILGDSNGADNFLILDENNTIISARHYSMIGTTLSTKNGSDNTLITNLNEENIVSVSNSSRYKAWNYALILPIDTYVNEFHSLFYNVKIFVLLAVLFCLMLAICIATKSFNVIRSIINVFEKQGINYDNNPKRADELDYIISNIILQIEMNNNMRQELIVQYDELQKTQAMALQAQITPHFLRNTLEVINLKAFEILNGINPVSDMLGLLGKMMDSFINSGDYLISIEKECEYNSIYIELLNIRYDKNINMIWDIDEELMKYNIVKLSMQPILENAFFHGLRDKKAEKTIRITGKMYSDYITLTIEDNGVGMADDELDKINSSLRQSVSSEKSVGLYNVNKRFQIIFGKDYGITLSHSPLNGVAVIIRFPKC